MATELSRILDKIENKDKSFSTLFKESAVITTKRFTDILSFLSYNEVRVIEKHGDYYQLTLRGARVYKYMKELEK